MDNYPRGFTIALDTLTYSGFWRLRSTDKSKVRLYNILRTALLVAEILFVASQYKSLWSNWRQRTVTDKAYYSAYTIYMTRELHRIVPFLYKVEEMEALQENLYGLWTEAGRTILEDKSKKMIMFMKFLCGYFMVIYPIVFGTSFVVSNKLFVIYEVPIEDDVGFALSFWMPAILLPAYIGHEMLFLGFILQLSAHYDMLELELKGLERETSWKQVKEVIKHHQAITQQIRLLENIYNTNILFQFIAYTIVICVFGSSLLLSNEERDGLVVASLRHVGGFSVALILIVYCSYGTHLHNKSERIAAAVYHSAWYQNDKRYRTSMATVLLAAQTPPRLSIGKVYRLEHRTFLKVLNVIYSYFAVFMNINFGSK